MAHFKVGRGVVVEMRKDIKLNGGKIKQIYIVGRDFKCADFK